MRRSDLAPGVRATLRRLPAPFASHYGVKPSPPPHLAVSVGSFAERHAAAMAALAKLDTLVSELRDPWLASRILLRREAVSSSAIEGTNSTLDELLAVEEGDGAEASERLRAAAQARDYALVLERVLPQARTLGPQVFTLDMVRDLHRAVMAGDAHYRDRPGELRTRVVWIGGSGDIAYSTYNPPPPDEVEACLRDNIAYMRGDGYETDGSGVVARLAVAHAHFEAVHPFRDGNGRVGRLLLPLMMAAEGMTPLYLSPYIEANRAAYYAALKAAQQRLDWAAMAGFVADAVTGTVDELLTTRRAMALLMRDWQARRRFRAGSASANALPLLLDYPVLTVNRLAGLLSVSFAQSAEAVRQLCAVGILRERTGHRRNRIFAATEVLSLINRPFGMTPANMDEHDGADGAGGGMSGGPR